MLQNRAVLNPNVEAFIPEQGKYADMVFELDCDQITRLINESLLNRTQIALNISTPHHSNVVTDFLFNNNATSRNVGNYILVVISTILIL